MGEKCVGGVCAGGTARDCSDTKVCTNDSCNEATDSCSHTGNSLPCDDGTFCNGPDTCNNGNCVIHAGNPCPGPDGDGNCSEACNEALDNCSAPDSDLSPCDDGLFCTGVDRCNNGACAGTARDCSDTTVCTTDTCNETTDSCSHTNNSSPCNDATFCNGADSCSGGTCSQHAGNPCPGPDGDRNCAESCNENLDNCTSADNNGSLCDDGNACTENDACSAGICAGESIPGCESTTTTTLGGDVLCGDASGDNQLTAGDALTALKTAVGSAECPLERCDFNGSGQVTAADALEILKAAVGQSVDPNCPPPGIVSVATTEEPATTLPRED